MVRVYGGGLWVELFNRVSVFAKDGVDFMVDD